MSTSTQKHTTEPWEVLQYGNKPPKVVIKGQPGFIAQLGYPHEGDRCSNAARIVACVNACAGIPDPLKAITAARRLAESMRDAEVKQSKKNDNASFIDTRDFCHLRGLAMEALALLSPP